MRIHLIQIFTDLGKTTVLSQLHLYWNLHVDLRIHTHLNTTVYLHYSSSSQYHLAPHLPLQIRSTHIAHADTPVLVILFECVFHIFEVSTGHHQHLLVGKIDHSSITSQNLVCLLELVYIGIELLLEIEIIRYEIVCLKISGECEEVDEDIVFLLLVTV